MKEAAHVTMPNWACEIAAVVAVRRLNFSNNFGPWNWNITCARVLIIDYD